MKTYAEEKGRRPFNWFEALEDTRAGKSTYFHWELIEMSSSWATCAVGNQCSVIPRTFGIPNDGQLYDLGIWFVKYIFSEDWTEALKVLHKIEARSAELINEINKG